MIADDEILPHDAIAFLKARHRDVADLFEDLTKGGAVPTLGSKRASLKLIAQRLEHHAQIEETLVYPETQPIDPSRTTEAREEHAVVRVLVEELKATDPSDARFMDRMIVLQEFVEHHVDQEERNYFPKIRKRLDPARMQNLGKQLAASFAVLSGGV